MIIVILVVFALGILLGIFLEKNFTVMRKVKELNKNYEEKKGENNEAS